MKINHTFQKTGNIPEIFIGINLLQMGLGEPVLVFLIICIWPIKDQFILMPYFFVG